MSTLKIDTIRKRVSKLKRYRIYHRDMGECVYCGLRGDLTLDHVVSIKDVIGVLEPCHINNMCNLVTACKTCNNKKTLHEKSMVLQYGRFKKGYPVQAVEYRLLVQEVLLQL